jgi:hypothetical protein
MPESKAMLADREHITLSQFHLGYWHTVDQCAVSATKVAQRKARAIRNYLAVLS